MKRYLVFLSTLFVAFGLSSCSSGPDMKEGNWEISTEVSMKGVPMKMPAMVTQQCLSKDDMIPQGGQQDQQNCTVSDKKTNGNTVSWSVVCKDGTNESKSDGSITYSGETFQGTMNISMSGGPMQISATNTISGRYLGPCK